MRKIIHSDILCFTRKLKIKDQALFFDLYLSSDEAGIVNIKGRGLCSGNYLRLFPLREQIIITGQYVIFKRAIEWALNTTIHPKNNGHAKIRNTINEKGFSYDPICNQIKVDNPFKFG